MAGNFRNATDEREANLARLKAETDRLIGEAVAERKKAEDDARVKAESRKATMLWLEKFIDHQIAKGILNTSQVETYLTQIRKEYGDQAMIGKYVSIVVRLLSHDFYGVESTTFRAGNGGLLYKGESYKNAKELYEYFVDLIAGFDPFDSQVWFDWVLLTVFTDPTYLPVEVLELDRRNRLVKKLQELVNQDKNALDTPELAHVTVEDALIIQDLLGGF